mmetsp:Transcript_32671/g.31888  ORF Transcript_32671/g.31888 Transcript_32671/m.31888 type:complete len:451 (-) Transcript_32671:68-1420(-)
MLMGPHVAHGHVVPELRGLIEQVVDVLNVVIEIHPQKGVGDAEAQSVGVGGGVVESEDLAEVAVGPQVDGVEPEPSLKSEHLPNEALQIVRSHSRYVATEVVRLVVSDPPNARLVEGRVGVAGGEPHVAGVPPPDRLPDHRIRRIKREQQSVRDHNIFVVDAEVGVAENVAGAVVLVGDLGVRVVVGDVAQSVLRHLRLYVLNPTLHAEAIGRGVCDRHVVQVPFDPAAQHYRHVCVPSTIIYLIFIVLACQESLILPMEETARGRHGLKPVVHGDVAVFVDFVEVEGDVVPAGFHVERGGHLPVLRDHLIVNQHNFKKVVSIAIDSEGEEVVGRDRLDGVLFLDAEDDEVLRDAGVVEDLHKEVIAIKDPGVEVVLGVAAGVLHAEHFVRVHLKNILVGVRKGIGIVQVVVMDRHCRSLGLDVLAGVIDPIVGGIIDREVPHHIGFFLG